MILGALSALLDLESDIEVVARAADGDQAKELLQTHQPDILVTDIEMPGLTGLELAEWLRQQQTATRVLIVTTFGRPGYLRRALDAGVRGYLLKDTPSAELASAVRQIAAGQRVIAPELNDALWSDPDPLNDRERQVLRLAEAGQTNKAIAASLNLSAGTVRNYLSEAAHKLGASNRVEASRIARQKGWL